MKLVIVADDTRVCIDNVCYDGCDLSALDPSIHAIQWDNQWGEIEYKSVFQDGQIVKPNNQAITDISSYQWVVNIWNEAKAAEEAAIAAALAELEENLNNANEPNEA